MSEINEINIPNIVIPKFGTNEVWLNGVPFVPSNHPPVTTQIGFPIVEMPGCVKMHKDNQDHVTRMPFDHDLVNQDEKGSTTLCPHGEYPTYDAMEYTPEQLIIQRETPAHLYLLHQKLNHQKFLTLVMLVEKKKYHVLAQHNFVLVMLPNQVMRELWDIDLLIMVKPVRHYMNLLHL